MIRVIKITLVIAVLVVLGDAARKLWLIYEGGGLGMLTRVPPDRLALEVMTLHRSAAVGVVAGLIIGVTVVCWSAGLRMLRAPDQTPADDGRPTPDQLIRAERAQRADAYLATRRAEREAGKQQS